MPTEGTAEGGGSFSPTQLAALRERRAKLRAEWVATADAEMSTPEGEAGLVAEISTEAIEKIHRIQAELDTVEASIKLEELGKSEKDLVTRQEDLEGNAPNYRDRQVKAAAAFAEAFAKVGRDEYSEGKTNAGALLGPKQLSMGQPLVARNPNTGENEVYPVNAIFTDPEPGKQPSVNLEATMRQMHIIAEDKFGQYDPVTGARLGHNAPVGRELVRAELGVNVGSSGVAEQVADTYLIQGGKFYNYEIQQNEMAKYCYVEQTPYINKFIVDRRTAVPNAALGDEAMAIANSDSSFDTLEVDPSKFGLLKGASHEAQMLMEPWSLVESILMDGAIAIGNKVGEQIVSGDGSGARFARQFTGLKSWALAAAGRRSTLAVNTAFLRGTNTFHTTAMATFLGTLPKEYFKRPNKRLVMALANWTKLQGVTVGPNDHRQLFESNNDIGDMALPRQNVRVVLDENFDPGTAANEIVWIYGDLESLILVMFGPPRVDYSRDHGFPTDQDYWRFIAYRGFGVKDPNGIRAGQVS